MKSGNTRETTAICVAAVLAVGLLTIPFVLTPDGRGQSPKGLVTIVALGVVSLSVALGFRYLSVRNRTRTELTGGDQYRQLAEEYRRLADLAITAQEHTDLKLGEVSAQLDHLREQNASLQSILKEVE